MAVDGWKSYALMACAGGCGVAAAGLIALAALGDLAVADQVGSIIGATAGLAGVVIAVWALVRSAGPTVEARDGAVAAGGHVGRVVAGSSNRLAPLPAVTTQEAPSGGGVVHASGAGSAAAAGDVHEVIHGDGKSS